MVCYFLNKINKNEKYLFFLVDSIHPGDSSSKQSSVSPNTSHDNYDMHHLNHGKKDIYFFL